MELTARRSERSADERCPYCHDALASAADTRADDLVACPGCATQHHRACVEELGRCTIRGCERPLVAAPETDEVAGRARRASVTEEVRRRLRERVRHFVSEHATAVEGPPHVRPPEPTPGPSPERPPVGRLLPGAPAERPRGPLAADPPARPRGPARAQVRPRDEAFGALLRAAQVAAREAPLAERADACRRVVELLRRPEAADEVEHPEAAAWSYERRAADLEALGRVGEGLSVVQALLVLLGLAAGVGWLTLLLSGR